MDINRGTCGDATENVQWACVARRHGVPFATGSLRSIFTALIGSPPSTLVPAPPSRGEQDATALSSLDVGRPSSLAPPSSLGLLEILWSALRTSSGNLPVFRCPMTPAGFFLVHPQPVHSFPAVRGRKTRGEESAT